MPPLYIPKKRRAEELPGLRDEREQLSNQAASERRKLRAHGSFDAEFWSKASNVESIILQKTRVMTDISITEFQDDSSAWERTDEARELFQQIRAQQHRTASFTAQSEVLMLNKPKRSLRETFMRLFTTSSIGLGISTGTGKRDGGFQADFRSQLLNDYASLDETGDWAWCPILHKYLPHRNVTASHIFPHKHGQAAMDAIFGQIRPSELFSSRNGLIISDQIEEHFDAGVITIVPDLPDRPSLATLFGWMDSKVRDFKVRIIDTEWAKLDRGITDPSGLKWRELDNRKLQFLNSQRPAARYLYFHYCLQVLRRAWKAGPGQKAVFPLTDELGKPVWATPGRYIGKKMILAFIEELGHEHKELLVGASPSRRGNRNDLIDTAAAQITNEADVDSDDDDNEEENEEEG